MRQGKHSIPRGPALGLLLVLCFPIATVAQTLRYRSIGTAANRSTGGGDGTVTATNGSTIVTGSGTLWQTWNRGRGDVIIIGGTNYMVARVDSETQLRLLTPFTGTTGSGKTYTIARQFTTLAAWEACISGGGGCTYFAVGSGDLVAEDRTEVGIAYKDSVFVFSSTLSFQGSNTDATHTIVLTADPGNRHNGVAGAGVVINQNGANEVNVRDSYVTVEWLELIGARGSAVSPIQVYGTVGPPVDTAQNVLLQNLLIHDFLDAVNDNSGIDLAGDNTVTKSMTVRNVMIWDGDYYGIEGDGPTDTALIENVSIYGMAFRGVYASQSIFTVRNTVVAASGSEDYGLSSGSLSGSNNTSSDTSANFGANAQTGVSAASVFVSSSNLHLQTSLPNPAIDAGLDLSASFWNDIDGQSRVGLSWDRGADESNAVTAVDLVSFTAEGRDGKALLRWETGSEYDNLGFLLYRARSVEGPFETVTPNLIPGLGSSPEGARYSYVDSDVENGVTYVYELEDVEITGRTGRHGPVTVTVGGQDGGTETETTPFVVYGEPDDGELRVVETTRDHVVMELRTEGFRAASLGDGTVRVEAAGFDLSESLPLRRATVPVPEGRRVELHSWNAEEVVAFDGLVPEGDGAPDVDARLDGTVRARRASGRAEIHSPSGPSVVLGSVALQGTSKKAFVELRPFGRNGSGHLVLARRLRFTVSFAGRARREPSEQAARGRRSRAPSRSRNVLARLTTRERGLYAVPFTQVGGGRSYSTSKLTLTRLGEMRRYFVEPDPKRFGPGSTLYFLSEGGAENPYGKDAVFELQVDDSDGTMSERPATRVQRSAASYYWESLTREENRYYQAALLDAEDPWLWEPLFAPQMKSFSFAVDEVAFEAPDATLTLWLQGASDSPSDPDHHVRVFVNGVFLTESSWNAKRPQRIEATLSTSLLREGENSLELEGVADTEASYSMVFLDRFELRYPRHVVMTNGYLEGAWSRAGRVEVPAAFAFDVTDEPIRIRAESGQRGVVFDAAPGHRYLLVAREGVRPAAVSRAARTSLASTRPSVDYLVIGPSAFLPAARPLVALRRGQGLEVKTVAVEDLYAEFGFGEARPEAIWEFLRYAYHEWQRPPRYVVLLGDGTYDFKDYLGTGTANRVPPLMVKTSYLWTASDPAYASVNGDDRLPDLALGRLPASSVEELETLIAKILHYESLEDDENPLSVLVADDPDEAGDFEADAESLAQDVLSNETVRKVYLGHLGIDAARKKVLESFDEGASTLSYIGHGGIHLWASEDLFDLDSVALLSPQQRQPILLTMNCLNGYFHFPYHDSLAESLVKADGRGAIAAFSPSGLSLNEPAHLLHEALLRELRSGAHRRLGDALLAAEASYADTGALPELLAIYHLFGDPALSLR